MAEQLHFDLSARPALGREAYFVSDANAVAVAMIDDWRNWPAGKLLLTGGFGAGKTHLAHVWAAECGARIVAASSLATADVAQLATGPICVEDIHEIAADAAAQEAAFHLHNLALAEGQPLLLTAQGAPGSWGLTLPDLASRLQGTTLVSIETPDTDLMGALFIKLFSDRQLSPHPDVVPYLARHAPRAFDLAGQIVEDIDRAALRDGREITRDLARSILGPHLDQS